MKRITLLLTCIFLIGCQTTQPTMRGLSDVTFISFPPGAVIEIDGEYKGRTPSIIPLKEYHLEREKYAQYYKIFIYPVDDGYCVQKFALNPYEIPKEIAFDLLNCAEEEKDVLILPNGNLGDHPDTTTY